MPTVKMIMKVVYRMVVLRQFVNKKVNKLLYKISGYKNIKSFQSYQQQFLGE